MSRLHRARLSGGLFVLFVLSSTVSPAAFSPEAVERLRAQLKERQYAEAEQGARELLEAVTATNGPDSFEVAQVLDVLVEARVRGGCSGPGSLDSC